MRHRRAGHGPEPILSPSAVLCSIRASPARFAVGGGEKLGDIGLAIDPSPDSRRRRNPTQTVGCSPVVWHPIAVTISRGR